MASFVFVGDSVTDCSRKRALRFDQTEDGYGQGWVAKVAPTLLARSSASLIWNRGYAGCLTHQLSGQDDVWPQALADEKADIFTVMIGINDIWHPFWKKRPHDIDAVIDVYKQLLASLNQKASAIIALEPIALPLGDVTQDWWALLDELTLKQERAVKEAGGIWVPLQDQLFKASGANPADYLSDGIHPTELGHRWLAKHWLRVVNDHQLVL